MSVLSDLSAALAGGSVDVVDLTAPLSDRTPILQLPPPFANTQGFALQEISNFDERGPAWYWNNFSAGEHVGTHFDAPVHWISGRDGPDVSQVPPRQLIGPAAVIDKSAECAGNPDFLLQVADVEDWQRQSGARAGAGAWVERTAVLVAEAVGRALARRGPPHVFGLIGSGNFAVTNAMVAEGAQFVAARPEGGAIFMADAYAQVTGDLAVCSVHQGPGLTNTMTGLAEAAKSRTPLLVLAADTAAAAIRSNFRIAQEQLVTSVGAIPERVYGPESAV